MSHHNPLLRGSDDLMHARKENLAQKAKAPPLSNSELLKRGASTGNWRA
jgi:hypothetical protein